MHLEQLVQLVQLEQLAQKVIQEQLGQMVSFVNGLIIIIANYK